MGKEQIICRYVLTDKHFREIFDKAKNILGNRYNFSILRTFAEEYIKKNDLKSLTAKYLVDKFNSTYPQDKKILVSSHGTPADNSLPETAVIKEYPKFWTRKEVELAENQDKLFIFLDNTDRTSGRGLIRDDSEYAKKYGKGHKYPTKETSAVLRGLDNALPITTQRWYHGKLKRSEGRWTNDPESVKEFTNVIKDDVDTIIKAWNTGKYTNIYLPKGGFFSEESISGLNDPERTEIKKILKKEIKRLYEGVGMPYSNDTNTSTVKKVISGGQSGVDTIGLRVARDLNIETGGTAPKNFYREQGYDNEDIRSYGLTEITDSEQKDFTARKEKSDPYTARTELNVRNSDGTVYFYDPSDRRGYIATKGPADEWGKPFLANPTASELREWLDDNDIEVLNIAGNRGSLLKNGETVYNIIHEALTMAPVPVEEMTESQKAEYLKRKARKEEKDARIDSEKWARYANGKDSFEVSSSGDMLGRQFSALAAVFEKDTFITIKIGGKKGKEQTFNIGEYSIEAAYQLIKGYEGNPKGSLLNKDGKVITEIKGKNSRPTTKSILHLDAGKHTPVTADAAQEFSYRHAYLPLWELWKKQNPKKINELKKAAKGKILTDRFAKTRVSQARALAEILYGTRRGVVTERTQSKYDMQRKNAIQASNDIIKIAKKISKEKIRIVPKDIYTEQHIAYMAQGKNRKGQDTTEKYPPLLSFALDDKYMNDDISLFVNPFEGEKDAIKKYIQWLMPNAARSLPANLNVDSSTERRRNSIRTYLSKGGWRNREILSDGTPENLLFAKVLKYIIENFRELKDRYNPVDIVEFGDLKHHVRVAGSSILRDYGDNITMFFSPKSKGQTDSDLNDSNSLKLERVVDNENNTTNSFLVSFPDNYVNMFTKAQKEGLLKTVAMAVPAGSTISLKADIADSGVINDFHFLVNKGFTRVGETSVTTESGNLRFIGVYKRDSIKNESVIHSREQYTVKDIRDKHADKHMYIIDSSTEYVDRYLRQSDEEFLIPIETRHGIEQKESNYWNDDSFDNFKTRVDDAIKKAKSYIDSGYIIVMPKEEVGRGSSALHHYAPKCFEYLQEQLAELEFYGNQSAITNLYLASKATTVESIDESPALSDNLNMKVMQSPRATLRQRFNETQIRDIARYYANDFDKALKRYQKILIENYKEELAKKETPEEKADIERRINKLNNPDKYQVAVINEVGIPAIMKNMEENLDSPGVKNGRTPEQWQLLKDSFQNGYNEIIFRYAKDLIFENTGILVKGNQSASTKEDEGKKEQDAEDTEGDYSPEMLWTYKHREIDPFSELAKGVRKIIGSIPMRDIDSLDNPDGEDRYIIDSVGEVRMWNARYIYESIMSRMADLSLDDADNFVRFIPEDQLSEEDLRKYPASKYPLGKPEFPILEGMKTRYSWAEDLIRKLEMQCNVMSLKESHRDMTLDEIKADPVAMATLGNVVSQFFANFSQSYVLYCTMVNGKILEENRATGEESLKKTVLANYTGNLRFQGIDMIYNNDQSVNPENVEKIQNMLKSISMRLNNRTNGKNAFWDSINILKKDYKSLTQAYRAAPSEVKDLVKELVDCLKGCGMVFKNYDVFCIAMENKTPGLLEMVQGLDAALNSVKGLPEDQHIFESSMIINTQNTGRSEHKFETPRFYWNQFFKKFGNYVTEFEYQSSTRIMGKARYSYTRSSYMSTTLKALTSYEVKEDGTIDISKRKKFIEENFMPYEWYYDKEKGKFKNRLLQMAYEGNHTDSNGREIFAVGHDMLCKKDMGDEKEYMDWSPADIYHIMFKELDQPVNKMAGCFIAPVLSDSQICKVIQADKAFFGDDNSPVQMMVTVVLQEIWRMGLVRKRNAIFNIQSIEEKTNFGIPLTEDEKTFYRDNLPLYEKYKAGHPEKLLEIANYDKNGSKFCFFPELNDYRLSWEKAVKSGDTFQQNLVRLLSKNGTPSSGSVGLKTIIEVLNNMPDSEFNKRAEILQMMERRTGLLRDDEGNAVDYGEYYTTITKEECVNRIAVIAVTEMMHDKIDNFFWERKPYGTSSGKIKADILDGILSSDPELASEFNQKDINDTADIPLTDTQREEKNSVYAKVYERAAGFYWVHTANMSHFLELMVGDIAFYKDPTTFDGSVDFAKRFKEVYGAGMKMNTNSKFGKKFENFLILEDSVRRSRSYDVIDAVLQRAVDEERITIFEKDAILYSFRNIMGTDAQAFRSATGYRDIMDMIGQHTDDLARAIHNLQNNTWHMNDFYTVLNTLKPFAFGPEEYDSGIDNIKIRNMVQQKNSEAVLLAIYNTLVGSHKGDLNYSPKLRGLNRAMEEIYLKDNDGKGMVMKYKNGEPMKAIDLVQYRSAVKVGTGGVVDINYSRASLDTVRIQGGFNAGKEYIDVGLHDSYYEIAEKLGGLLDEKKITFKEYNDAMDRFEPDENEVFEIIQQAIYKNGDESLGYDKQILHKFPFKYYSIQQPTPNHYTDETEGTFGSQPRHIIMGDLPENITINIKGNEYKGRDAIRKRYNSLIVANLIDCFENEIRPLYENDKSDTPAIFKLQQRLYDIIDHSAKYGDDLRNALQIVRDKNGNYTFSLPPNNLTVFHQLQEAMISMFKNAIHRQDINGGSVIIAADVGYSKHLKIFGKRNRSGKLAAINGIECMLPAHMEKTLKPFMIPQTRTDEDGQEINYWILDPKKLEAAGLDRAIGYRIPTEGLYSIMPLMIRGFLPQQSGASIVVAQEITTLTGGDNDVDKLFLMIKALNKGLTAITTPKGVEMHPLEMTKEQRDNEIIDIFTAVITHEEMAHRWLHPGNYNNITLNAKRLKILKNKEIRDSFKLKAHIGTDSELLDKLTGELSAKEAEDLYRKVMDIPAGKDLSDKHITVTDIVTKFAGKYLKPLSPVYPDTFVKMHQTYMAGVAEKGIFANNTSDHAKLQWANVKLSPAYTFTFEGNLIEKLDVRYIVKEKNGKKYRHYISDDCAEGSAASVDNGKDPQLDDINCTKQTAPFAGLMWRFGLGIEETALLMAQPLVDRNVHSHGTINYRKSLEKMTARLEKWLIKNGLNPNDDRFNWRVHNFTKRELYENILAGHEDVVMKGNGSDPQVIERIASLYRTYSLIISLLEVNKSMKAPKEILHYDSPTHAAESSVGGVMLQTKLVQSVNERKDYLSQDRPVSGEDQILVYDIDNVVSAGTENKKTGTLKDITVSIPKYQLFDKFMSTQLPITQAFYTLGIEKVLPTIASQFACGRKELQKLTDRLWDFLETRSNLTLKQKVKIVTQMYKDWTVYSLSKTKMFGDDENMTFDQKRQYYLLDFPKKFQEMKALPEFQEFDALRRLDIRKRSIMLNLGGDTLATSKDFIRDSFDSLIMDEDASKRLMAQELFHYSYYLNGFDFKNMSFGNMFSTEFQLFFDECMQKLRDMNTEPISDADLDNFFDQFIVVRGKMGLLREIDYEDASLKSEGLQQGFHNTGHSVDYYGGIDQVDEYVLNKSVINTTATSEILRLNRHLTELYGTVIYEPLDMNTTLHYNANQTMSEIAETVYDQDKINASSRLGVKMKSPDTISEENYQLSKSPEESETGKDATIPLGAFEEQTSDDDYSAIPRNAYSSESDTPTQYSEEDMAETVTQRHYDDSNAESGVPKSLEDYLIKNIRRLPSEPSEDLDIKIGQNLIRENNDGEEICIPRPSANE